MFSGVVYEDEDDTGQSALDEKDRQISSFDFLLDRRTFQLIRNSSGDTNLGNEARPRDAIIVEVDRKRLPNDDAGIRRRHKDFVELIDRRSLKDEKTSRLNLSYVAEDSLGKTNTVLNENFYSFAENVNISCNTIIGESSMHRSATACQEVFALRALPTGVRVYFDKGDLENWKKLRNSAVAIITMFAAVPKRGS